MNLGDIIADNPIVHTIGRAFGCVDLETNELKEESTCAQIRQSLNEDRYTDAFYEFFWRNSNKQQL